MTETVGYFCAYTPLPLLAASGLQPVRFFPESEAPDAAGGWLHDNLCPQAKRLLDRAVAGDLPQLRGVLLVNSCDAMRRLADAWRLIRPGDRVWTFDLPVHDESPAQEFLAGELERLAAELVRADFPAPAPEAVFRWAGRYDRLAQLLPLLRQRVAGLKEGPALWQAECNLAAATPLEESVRRIEDLIERPPRGAPADGVPVFLFGNVLPQVEAF